MGKIRARLRTPVLPSGDRKDIHLINTTDEVLYPVQNGEAHETLTNKIQEIENQMEGVIDELNEIASRVNASLEALAQKGELAPIASVSQPASPGFWAQLPRTNEPIDDFLERVVR